MSDESAVETFLKALRPASDVSGEAILQSLQTSDVNLSMKTHVKNPMALSVLDTITAYLGSMTFDKGVQKGERKFPRLVGVFETFLMKYRENMVSFNREGRKEVIDGLKAMIPPEYMGVPVGGEGRADWLGRKKR